MLKAIINFLNLNLGLLDYFEQQHCLCELKSDNEGKVAPVEYVGDANYTVISHDAFDGVSYWRLRDKPTQDVLETKYQAGKRVEVKIPLRLVFSVRRTKLTTDDAYAFDRIRQTIVSQFNFDDGILKTTLGAEKVTVSVPTSNGNAKEVWDEETSETGTFEPTYAMVYGSIDIDVSVIYKGSCLPTECDDIDSNILHAFDFCKPSVFAQLTPEQVTCLEGEICEPLCEQLAAILPEDVVVDVFDCLSGAAQTELLDSECVIPPCADATITVNSTPYGTAPSGGSENVEVVSGVMGTTPRGSLISGKWFINDSTFQINGVNKDSLPPETTFNLIVRLNGVADSGSYNAATDTLDITSTPIPSLSILLSNSSPTYGSTITVTATPTNFTPTRYIFFAYNGSSIQWIADQAGAAASWVVNIKGSYDVYAIANELTTSAWTVTPAAITVAFDADAQAFLDAALITDFTTSKAINDLVVALKGYSIWTKFHAIYPFVGTNSFSQKFNLKNPLDTNAAYRLTFFGGVTFSANGVQFNGTNAYADTFLNDNTAMTLNDSHISFYSRTDVDGLYCDMGVLVGGAETNIFSKYINVLYPRNQATNAGIANATSSLGLFVSNRVGSTEVRAFQNGVVKIIANASSSKANATHHIGRLNGGGFFYSPRQVAFASIGTGLTDTDGANMYTAVQAFQTTLSRQA